MIGPAHKASLPAHVPIFSKPAILSASASRCLYVNKIELIVLNHAAEVMLRNSIAVVNINTVYHWFLFVTVY